MFTIEQLQALDYLLKRLINNRSCRLYGTNLKLVIDVNGTLWYGDFIQMKENSVYQAFIADDGDITVDKFYASGSNAATLLKCIWDSYTTHADRRDEFWSNPFEEIAYLPHFFETLVKILRFASIPDNCSPFYPYLLNAKSVNGKMELPFINLEGEKIKLISIIKTEE